jgi:hypothetical protein
MKHKFHESGKFYFEKFTRQEKIYENAVAKSSEEHHIISST